MADDKVKQTQNVETKEAPTNLMDLPNVECKCGNLIWEYGFIIKRLEAKGQKPKNIPIDVILCKRCGSVLQDGVPLLRKSTV